jgi:hypothetical protein
MNMRRAIGWVVLVLAAAAAGGCDLGGPAVVIGEATVDEIAIAILESFPVQVLAVLRGSVPDACTEVGPIVQHREGNRYTLIVRTRRPADAFCVQVIVPFEAAVPLDVLGLPAGTYTVTAGEAEAGFELAVDNVPQ